MDFVVWLKGKGRRKERGVDFVAVLYTLQDMNH